MCIRDRDLGLGGTWIQTSYNSNIRGKYAGIGDRYDSKKDEFIAPVIIEETPVIIEETPVIADETQTI